MPYVSHPLFCGGKGGGVVYLVHERGEAVAGQDTLMKALTQALSGGAMEVLGVYGVELVEPAPTDCRPIHRGSTRRDCEGS